MADDPDQTDRARQTKPHQGTGFPEPPGKDPGDVSQDAEPHHALNNPASDPDPAEWPDPNEKRPVPKGPGKRTAPGPGDRRTSEPHPSSDPEARDKAEPPERDELDD